MKRLLTIFFIFISLIANAQTPIQDGGFENWDAHSLGLYYEPSGNWWTTLNSLANVTGPITVTRVTDVHSGTYAARLESKMYLSSLITGFIVSGTFLGSPTYNIKEGKPFSDKPVKLKGYYKYTPVNGDSCVIFAILSKFNPGTNKHDTVAIASLVEKNTVATYSPFDLIFDYKISGINPDTIIVGFASSAAGKKFLGQVGSTLYIDDVSLEYSSSTEELLMDELPVSIFPNPAKNILNIVSENDYFIDSKCIIYAINGKIINEFTVNKNTFTLDLNKFPAGNYIINFCKNNKLFASQKFTTIK